MLSTTFMLLLSSALMMLRLGENASSFPRPLKAQEERECIERMLEGDMEARNTLIAHNLRLVMHIIKKYYTTSADAEDLVSIGTIGLIKGVSTYRPDKGVRLATYASRCIENEILMHFRGRRKSAGDVSLSGVLDADGDDDGPSILDTIADDTDMLEELARRESIIRVRQAVETALPPREAEIIRLRYGLDGRPPMPQREVAEIMGISRSYVVSRANSKESLKALIVQGFRTFIISKPHRAYCKRLYNPQKTKRLFIKESRMIQEGAFAFRILWGRGDRAVFVLSRPTPNHDRDTIQRSVGFRKITV